jgi:hypothetical protein
LVELSQQPLAVTHAIQAYPTGQVEVRHPEVVSRGVVGDVERIVATAQVAGFEVGDKDQIIGLSKSHVDVGWQARLIDAANLRHVGAGGGLVLGELPGRTEIHASVMITTVVEDAAKNGHFLQNLGVAWQRVTELHAG